MLPYDPKRVKMTIFLDRKAHAKLKEEAGSEGLTLSQWVAALIHRKLGIKLTA